MADLVSATKTLIGIGGLGNLGIQGYGLLQQDSVLNPNLVFPADLLNTRQFFMSFKFSSYQKPTIYATPILQQVGGVVLPIPNQLAKDTSVTYAAEELGAAVGATLESLLKQKATPTSILNGGASQLTTAAGAGITGAAGEALQNVAPGVASAISASTGISVNPYLTLLFKSPKFRRYNFSWRLMAKSPDESATIRDIIKTFEYNMLPGIDASSSVLFKYPNVVNVIVNSNVSQNDYLYKFKTCVVEDFKVNYTPGSTPAFFGDTGAPVALDISVALTEIEMWTREDVMA